MDDTTNREYSRAPEIEDLLDLCKKLNQEGAQYLLIGGFAVMLHGYVRATKDIDLLVESSPQNIRRIKQALQSLPDNAISLIQDDEVEKYSVVRIADEIVIDLMEKACGINFAEAVQEKEEFELEGLVIPTVSKEMLIRMKATFRPSDQADVNYLKVAIEAEKKK